MMQKLIGFLLRKFTPFRVYLWEQGRIAGIGYYPGPHQKFENAIIITNEAK